MTAGTRWVLLLESDDAGRLSEAAAMAASAASLGTDITLVWLSGALEALVSGRLDGERPLGHHLSLHGRPNRSVEKRRKIFFARALTFGLPAIVCGNRLGILTLRARV
jgi:hypothetical protein